MKREWGNSSDKRKERKKRKKGKKRASHFGHGHILMDFVFLKKPLYIVKVSMGRGVATDQKKYPWGRD